MSVVCFYMFLCLISFLDNVLSLFVEVDLSHFHGFPWALAWVTLGSRVKNLIGKTLNSKFVFGAVVNHTICVVLFVHPFSMEESIFQSFNCSPWAPSWGPTEP